MINYISKQSEKKNLEEKMKTFENNYIIKSLGTQDIYVTAQNDTLYIYPSEYSEISEVTMKQDIHANFIKGTKDFIFLRLQDQIYKISYEPNASITEAYKKQREKTKHAAQKRKIKTDDE